MQNGGTHSDWSRRDQRRNTIPFQKTQNGWAGWLRRTRNKHCDYKGGCCDSEHVNDENLPQPDCLERSLLKRGPSRRTHSICVVETRYPCKDTAYAPESQKSGSCKYEDNAIKSPGSFYGNKSIANSGKSVKEKEPCSKRVCRNNRRPSNDAVCCRVFQALGDNVLIEWLTPGEVHNTEIAFEWDFDWGRAWHGGKVKNKAIAARIQFDLQHGLQAEHLLAKYDQDFAFSAFWYLLDVGEIDRLANEYKHYKSIKKLCRLIC